MEKNRGYVVTWDGVLALLFVIAVFSGIIGMQYLESADEGRMLFSQVHLVSENSVETLEKLGLLELIGMAWSNGNYSIAYELSEGDFHGATRESKDVLDQLVPQPMGYRITVDNDTIYDTRYEVNGSRPLEEDASVKTSGARIVSGYSENMPRAGWTARAWLYKTEYGSTNLLSDTPGGLGETDFQLELSAGESEVLYLRVPLGFAVTNASLSISWSSISTTTTTSATSSPSTTMPFCSPCPDKACPAPAYGYSTLFTNWHKFTLGSMHACDVTVWMIPSSDSDYDLYMKPIDGPLGCDVGVEGGNYDDANCNSNSLFDGNGFVEWCVYDNLPPGTYYMRIDCYYDALGISHCPGTYDITLESPCFP